MITWVKTIYTWFFWHSSTCEELVVTFVFLTLASDFYGEQAGSCIQQCDDNMERNDHGTKCPDGIVKWFYALQRSLTVNSVFLKQVQISLTQKVPLTCKTSLTLSFSRTWTLSVTTPRGQSRKTAILQLNPPININNLNTNVLFRKFSFPYPMT